jgi:hypothetical protein
LVLPARCDDKQDKKEDPAVKQFREEMDERAASGISADALAGEMWEKHLKSCPAELIQDDLEALLKTAITLQKVDSKDVGGGRVLSRPNKVYNLDLYDALVRLAKGEKGSPVGPTADGHGKTALMYAAEAGELDVVAELIKLKNSEFSICRYSPGNIELMQAYIDRCDDPSDKTYGYSALMYAAANGHADVVSYLLNAGADPNAQCKFAKFNAIQLAKMNGHDKVVAAIEWKQQHDTSISPWWSNISTWLAMLGMSGVVTGGWLIKKGLELNTVLDKANSDARVNQAGFRKQDGQ